MGSKGQLLVVSLHALLGLTVLAAATVLSILHDPISVELGSIFGVILGLAGAGSAAIATLGTAVNGKSIVSAQVLADANAALREAVDHLAGARAQLPQNAPAKPDVAAPPPPPPTPIG